MSIKKHIPNSLTLTNLACGCFAIVKIFEGNLVLAACFVGIALICDFLDGFTARLLKVASPIGKDLDSLADMVTFGVVPGMMMFKLIARSFVVGNQGVPFGAPQIAYLAFIIPVISGLRLAKFNNDTRQTDSFIGLNTPSNTMVICSFPLILQFQPELTFLTGIINNPWFLLIHSVLFSLLLVSEIPFFALKFKNFGWAYNKVRYSFLLLSLLLILFLKFAAVPAIIILYILISIVNNIFSKKQV